jgi:hypothetical protein
MSAIARTAALLQATPIGAFRPERALIEAPAEHREGWIAMIRSRHSGRPQCATSGHSMCSLTMAQVDRGRAKTLRWPGPPPNFEAYRLAKQEKSRKFSLRAAIRNLSPSFRTALYGISVSSFIACDFLLWPRRVLIDPRGARCRARFSRRNLVFGWVHVGPGP